MAQQRAETAAQWLLEAWVGRKTSSKMPLPWFQVFIFSCYGKSANIYIMHNRDSAHIYIYI